MPNNDTCIVVLGMHRSGTSLVAGLLYRLGVNMGTTLRKPDRYNVTGYYEDLDFRDLNKAIITRAGGRWFNPPNTEDVAGAVHSYRKRVEKVISERSGLWGFKDPQTVFTIHALEEYLPEDIRFIHVSRNPLDIIDSLKSCATIKGYKRTSAHWWYVIRRYTDRLQDYLSRTVRPTLSVEYEILPYSHTARDAVKRIASFCDLDWRDEELIDNALQIIKFREVV